MPKNPRTKERHQKDLAKRPEGSSRLQDSEEATPPDDKQGRLLSLAQKLQQLFPEQYEELAQVIEQVEKEKLAGAGVSVESEQGSINSPPIAVPGEENKATKGRPRAGSTTSNPHDQQKEEEEIDPRGRAPEQKDPLIHIFVDHSNILYGLPQPKSATPYRERSNTLPTRTTTVTTRVDSLAVPTAIPTSTRPLPVSSTSSNSQSLSRSFPTTSPLAAMVRTTDLSTEFNHPANSDGGGLGVADSDDPRQKKKKPSRRLWYAAFVLVLERGRPITRRVVVGSKMPVESIPIGNMEQFGYEVRVLIRVPNTDDGLDRERSKGKAGPSKVSHAKAISRSTSSESGHILGTPSNKVKYREQGVDELLQLKLYQAITDPEPEDIPDGSTIVLATGDGGPGQFDEHGFLGPIKTALRRGWNVELYAWEDSLSRAWAREFGDKAESGIRGVFRIIGMKQFATWLAHD